VDSEQSDFELGDEHAEIQPHSINRYDIKRTLGSGGMATVMLAYDKIRKEEVALKVPLWQPTEKTEQTERRFLREAHAAMTVQHEKLCAIYDVGIDGGTFFVAMEYIDGMTLTDLLQETGPLPEVDAALIIASVGAGLQELHRNGMVHRDIKPENIMIDKAGRPLVLDFGLAKCFENTEDVTELTANDQRVGTPAYMSPEQIMGDELTPQADVFSLGLVLWSLLCNQSLFDGNMMEVIDQIMDSEYASPRKYRPDLSPEMERICMKAIAYDSSSRYQDMTQLQQDLNLLLDQ
jgi:serine/threonine protein kinase